LEVPKRVAGFLIIIATMVVVVGGHLGELMKSG
jgi:hypothetical protein